MTTDILSFKWTTSRGRDTYGYNICSLWVNGVKATSCNGGGYDMQGTAFGDWLEKTFQDRLMSIKHRAHRVYTGTLDDAKPSGDALYGMTYDAVKQRVTLDGGCGFESMRRIADAIGVKLEYKGETKNEKLYAATYDEVTA